MTRIQIVILFTKLSNLSNELKERARQIVAEEYCRVFSCAEEEVTVSIHEGNAKGQNTDVHLFIQSDEAHYNEGVLRREMRQAISSRYRLLFPSSLGFNGIITAADGEGKKTEKKSPDSSSDITQKQGTKASNDQFSDPIDLEKRSEMYVAVTPKYSFDMVQLPQKTLEDIDKALGRIKHEKKVFEDWGLYAIMPSPVSALGFFGPPGTGKTLTAEAIAEREGKKILRVSYAEIENKYVGEGPKNVKAVFHAAERQDAILFIDEADSLLSKRLTNVTDGTGQAFNSMRSQMLMSLEEFHGIVIFATNLVVNYDKAVLSRIINVVFEFPDAKLRKEIWEKHLLPKVMNGHRLSIPLSKDVNLDELAEKYELCGRDIRNTVIDACVEACEMQKNVVDQECLCRCAQACIQRNEEASKAADHTQMDSSLKKAIANKIEEDIKNKNQKTVKVDDLKEE